MTVEVKEFEAFVASADRGALDVQAQGLNDFCEKWEKYKEYLSIALTILPIPEAIKQVIRTLMEIADKFCQSNT